jgi:hypothetical protein
MYVEAICPLCLAVHIVPEDMRGEKYRCEECEEVFIINRKSRRTSKRPPRPREVKPADEVEEVTLAPADEVLPEAKRADERPKKRRPGDDDDEVFEIPDEAVGGGAPRTGSPTKRRAGRRGDDDEEDRPRKRPARRSGAAVALMIGLGVVGLGVGVGLIYAGIHFAFPEVPAQTGQAQANKDGPDKAPKGPDKEPMKKEPPKKEPPPDQGPPRTDPPKKEPPKVAAVLWDLKVDPPVKPLELPAGFTKEIKVPGLTTKAVFPTATSSPCLAVGDNFTPDDVREVWDLQANERVGKVSGSLVSASAPVLSPDGAHLALPANRPGAVDVWAVKTNKKVTVEAGSPGFLPELIDFAGPGTLLTANRIGSALQLQVWDADSGRRVREVRVDKPVRGSGHVRDTLAISPGGAYLALAVADTLWVYDLKTGQVIGERPLREDFGKRPMDCRGLTFSPDGSELAGIFWGGPRGSVFCWDMARGDFVCEAPLPAGTSVHVALSGAYRGRAIDWLAGRRGWLLYGQLVVERKPGAGPAAAPAGLQNATAPVSHLIGPEHIATLPGGLGGNKVLTVTRFDPDKVK